MPCREETAAGAPRKGARISCLECCLRRRSSSARGGLPGRAGRCQRRGRRCCSSTRCGTSSQWPGYRGKVSSDKLSVQSRRRDAPTICVASAMSTGRKCDSQDGAQARQQGRSSEDSEPWHAFEPLRHADRDGRSNGQASAGSARIARAIAATWRRSEPQQPPKTLSQRMRA